MLSKDESWSPKNSREAMQTTAMTTRMSPYSTRP